MSQSCRTVYVTCSIKLTKKSRKIQSSDDQSCDQVPVLKSQVTIEEQYDSGDDGGSEAVEEEGSWRVAEPASCDCICSHFEGTSSIARCFLQHVELDEARRWQIHQPIKTPPSEYASEEYSLSELLTEMKWTEVHKIALAVQLAHALAYYYDGGWFSGWWQQSNICFFRCGSRISCKPWLKVSLPDRVQRITDRRGAHPFPQLLELGTVLLELQLGQSLNSILGRGPAKNVTEKFQYASVAFFDNLEGGRSILWQYRDAIKFCLQPNRALKKTSMLREAIYNRVVLPLERIILEFNLGEEKLEALDLGQIKRAAYHRGSILEPRKPASEVTSATITRSTASVKIQVPSQPPMGMFQTSELEEGFELFGDEEELQNDKESVSPIYPYI